MSEKKASPSADEVEAHYLDDEEAIRLETGVGRLEGERTRRIVERFLPEERGVIRDVGGGAGVYALWLAGLGHEVHLIDLVPLHVEQARVASLGQPDAPLADIGVGDARSLPWGRASSDVVLMLGPLYHLTSRHDRIAALSEAHRVLKPGGTILAAGISRFASVLDGLRANYISDPVFQEIALKDIATGHHDNRNDARYFMNTFFHHPDELLCELSTVGFEDTAVIGIEGPSWISHHFDEQWDDPGQREFLLQVAAKLEAEPSLLGCSAHLMGIGTKC